MVSIGNILHRTIVFGAVGFGAYGIVVIGQNFVVKRRALKEYDEAQKAAALNPNAVLPPPPKPIINTRPLSPQ